MRLLYYLYLILLLASTGMSAQVSLSGVLFDQNEEPVIFAEVIGMSLDSFPVAVVMTEIDGTFSVEMTKGTYILLIRQFGTILYSENIELLTDMDLGKIEITNTHNLEEITVTASQPLVVRKIDRLVFNVENTTKASEGSALDILEVTPGLRVRNDAIQMIGKSDMAIMVNGKLSQISGEELTNFLKSISSEDIKNIEVITAPPAKYDVEGNSGLVNIQLKKAKLNSWSATLGSSYRRRSFSQGATFGNFIWNKNKLNVAASLNGRKGKQTTTQDDYAYFEDGLWYTSDPYILDPESLNGRLSVDYTLNPKWTIGSQYIFNIGNHDYLHDVYTPIFSYTDNEIIRYLESDNLTIQKPKFHSANLHNSFSLDTLGSQITTDLDYFKYSMFDDKVYEGISSIQNVSPNRVFKGTNENYQTIANWSGKLDVLLPLSWLELSFGGKVSISESLDNITFFNSGVVDSIPNNIEFGRSVFQYNENVQALYASGNKKIGDKLQVQVGLRLEATQTKSLSKTLEQLTENDYVKIFPTVYLGYDLNENSSLSFNYGRRIKRPGFYQLNSNIEFINPFQFISGNPFLQPAFIDNIEFSYTHKNWDNKLYFSYEDNMFGQISIPDPVSNFVSLTNENYFNVYRVGLSESYYFDKFKWWSSANDFDINYSISDVNLNEYLRRTGFSSSFSSYNTFKLDKKGTVKLGLNYWHAFPAIDGLFKVRSMGAFSASLKFSLLNKKLKIALRGKDLFKTQVENLVSNINGIYQEGIYYYDSRYFDLSVSYKFGNNKIRSNTRATGNSEERKRTGN